MLSKSQIIFLVIVGSIMLLIYIGLAWFWFYFGWFIGFGWYTTIKPMIIVHPNGPYNNNKSEGNGNITG